MSLRPKSRLWKSPCRLARRPLEGLTRTPDTKQESVLGPQSDRPDAAVREPEPVAQRPIRRKVQAPTHKKL